MAVVGAVAAVAALGYGIYAGEKSGRAQKQAVRKQEKAQKESAAAASAQQRRAEMESRKANARRPDTLSLLAREQKSALSGPSATMLTGSSGATQASYKLGGGSSLLGG
jgi:uncharacterized protein HemX